MPACPVLPEEELQKAQHQLQPWQRPACSTWSTQRGLHTSQMQWAHEKPSQHGQRVGVGAAMAHAACTGTRTNLAETLLVGEV